MRRKITSLAAMLVLLSPDLASAAGSVPMAKQFGPNTAVTIDQTLAYITFRMQQKTELRFIRVPTAEDRNGYDRDRAAAFAKAHAHHSDLQEAGFSFPAIEKRQYIDTAMGPIFDRRGNDMVYLVAVQPGSYILYGQIALDGPGAFGTCFCMGTVRFDAPAGKVTDIGRVRLTDDPNDPPYPPNGAGLLPFAVLPPDASMPPAGRLAALPVERADFHAVDKMANVFGVLIDRLPAIPGVLAYDRDRVIDLKTETPHAAPAGAAPPQR